MFEAQAQQLIKKLWEGAEPFYLPGEAKTVKLGEEKKKAVGKIEYDMSRLKTLDRHEIKHDLEYMNMATELRK